MKKTLTMAALILAGYSATAQDLAYKIPKNAQAVATLQTDQLFNLLSVQEFNESFMGRMMLKAFSDKHGQTYTSIRDLGMSLSAPTYYYTRKTDSISYHCLLVPLADARKLERFVSTNQGMTAIERDGDLNTLVLSKRDKSMLLWNNEMALVVMADLNNSFFEEDATAARYGIQPEHSYTETTDADVVEEMAAVDTAMMAEAEDMVIAEPMPPVKPRKGKAMAHRKGSKSKHVIHEEAVEPAEAIAVEDVVMEEPTGPSPRSIKDSIGGLWAQAYATKVFNKRESASSILDNEAYRNSIDKKAVASFYVANLEDMTSSVMGGYYTGYFGTMLNGYQNISAKLYLDEKAARITTQVELNDSRAAMYRKIYNHKMNPDFVKYVNSDKVIAFMGYSIDTKGYLEEMPKMMQQTYGRFMGLNSRNYKQEMDLGSDLFSLLLDEEAVGRVIKGDALLLFNGVSSKEVTYTSYDYNSDTYERKEVEKTKTETLPDFLLMLSSDDTRLIRKLLNYGINKGQIKVRDGIYVMKENALKSPLPLNLLIKDGIIFLGTSFRDLQDINMDRYEARISKGQKNLLLDNNMSFFFNPRKLEGKIPQKEIGSLRKWTEFNTFLGNTGLLYAKTNGINGNTISGELVAEVPEGKGNALQYFFSLIDDIANKH